jgi:putative transposase
MVSQRPTYGKHRGAKLLTTVDYESGEIYWEEHEQYDAQVFLSFHENIVAKYPEGKTVMILDNARIHHAMLIQPFLQ